MTTFVAVRGAVILYLIIMFEHSLMDVPARTASVGRLVSAEEMEYGTHSENELKAEYVSIRGAGVSVVSITSDQMVLIGTDECVSEVPCSARGCRGRGCTEL